MFFKPIPLFVQFYKDKVVVTRLDLQESITEFASEKYYNNRLLIADFYNAENTLRLAINKLTPPFLGIFRRNLKMTIQPMEMTEGEISSVEKRTYFDIAEHAGAKYVEVINQGDRAPL